MAEQDLEYWKKLYNGKWIDGSRRAKKVGDLIKSFGFEVNVYGFLADSNEYSKVIPNEKGIPDLEITLNSKRVCLLEITGTKIMRGSGIWIRSDKFDYATNHPEENCWLGHIEESSNKIKFLKLDNKEQYETINPTLRGVRETYKKIPENSLNLIEADIFRKILLN